MRLKKRTSRQSRTVNRPPRKPKAPIRRLRLWANTKERLRTLTRAASGHSTVRQNICWTVTVTTMIRKRLLSISPNPPNRAIPLQNISSASYTLKARMCRNKCSTLCIGSKAPCRMITNTPNICSAKFCLKAMMWNGIPNEPRVCCAAPLSKETNMRLTPSVRHISTEISSLKTLTKPFDC